MATVGVKGLTDSIIGWLLLIPTSTSYRYGN